MDHDDDVCAGREREAVAGLLVAAITAVPRMHLDLHTIERARDLYGLITAGVVDEDDQVDHAL